MISTSVFNLQLQGYNSTDDPYTKNQMLSDTSDYVMSLYVPL